ncbi:MAG: T9SS type A sorting domain-containing protein, partial [Candidatus Cloacimonetes bacterium]|nr:T9SS type A sorting domain-containing protein [Candidatus Cloacimonadota bacterium]
PNPLAGGSTKISFLLPKTARAELKIYNIRGELVKDLYNGIAYGDDEVEEVIWDGRDDNGVEQVTGIYLYQLKVNGKVYETKRLIVIR